MEEKVAQLEDLVQGLGESTHLVAEQVRRVRADEGVQSDESDFEEGDDDSEDEQGEQEKNKLLLKLEHIRDNLKEAIRKGKEERTTKLARLYERRFELEQLNAQLAADDHAPLAPAPRCKSSWLLHLIGAVFFGTALVVALVIVVDHTSLYHERELAMRYQHPT
ncbi:uncharacterized protein ACA1_290430 [Acanthamoeba castellanii str. Neff]|uniref:Transmembrane protein n=1 Tax=Acanthamoeba castellanii (strain ATCC 30010 / Neff) TaxID=1257118 RepID=L8HI59_ACACF|nr:uncharacterized protein ACA1_290430 [Acanthamoeba castellanii str. Neff]ELR25269.1 hypothetical protein ACA1_290430 [Acanthamoeba castellanii str. Neff]